MASRLKSEIAASEPELWNTWISDPESLVLDGAETLDQVMERSLAGLQRLMEKHKGETFAVVSHRGVLKPMLSGALGIAKPRFWRLHMDTGSTAC
jgi:broad specificity phosphatase PhoE